MASPQRLKRNPVRNEEEPASMNLMPPVGDGPARSVSARRSALRMAWARLRRLAELFPVTPLGLLLAVGAYAAVKLLAHAQLDLVWLVVGYVGLGLAALSPLVVLLVAGWLKLRGPLPHATDGLLLETGTFTDTGFRLPSPFYLPLVQLRWEWLEPSGAQVEQRRQGAVLCERVQASDRGRFDRIERRVLVSDAFGLSRVAVRLLQTRAVDVLPRLGGLRQLPSLSALASGDAVPHPMGLEDGDRLELRRYTAGDPARFIHWKVLARTGKLMVRTPERALSVARRMAAFLIAGERDDASAAVARLALERRLLGNEWSFGTDDEVAGVSSVGEALAALMRSSRARGRGGEGLAAFLQRVEQKGPVSLVVFAPSRPGDWLERVASLARRRKLRVVIGTDGVYDRERPALLRRLLAFYSAPEGTGLVELDQVLRTLAQAGAEVTVLDRGSGRALGKADRRALLAFGARQSLSPRAVRG
jgi:uncharacterized protein (DUF58 family)